MRRGAKVLLIVLLCAAGAALAQDQEQFRIHAKVDLVVVPVTVKGSGDKLITGLKKEDFVVMEDGRQQTITNFTIDPVPLSAAVVVDTGLGFDSLGKIEKTFPALTASFSQFDEVAIYRYDKFVTKVADFAQADPDALTATMDKLREITPRAITDAGLGRSPFSTPGPVINGAPVVTPNQVGVTSTVPTTTSNVLNDAIFTAASDLARRERSRRKMLLVISDGQNGGNEHMLDETIQRLLETGVQVYAVGLDQPFPYNRASVLDTFAKNSGGDVYFVNSIQSIEHAYAVATEEARNQYTLGYISNNEPKEPGPVFRDIQVKIAGNNLKTLHRKGYYQYP